MKITKSLVFKIIGAVSAGGATVGTGIALRQRSKKGSNYLKKLGFKVTDYDDPVWDRGFVKYQKYLETVKNEEATKNLPTTLDGLKKKCQEYLNFDQSKLSRTSDSFDLTPFQFTSKFCSWKTTMWNALSGSMEGLKKLDLNGDEQLWTEISSHTWSNKKDFKKIWSENLKTTVTDEGKWKEKIKEFCKAVNWDTEMIEVDGDLDEEWSLCTNFAELEQKAQLVLTKY